MVFRISICLLVFSKVFHLMWVTFELMVRLKDQGCMVWDKRLVNRYAYAIRCESYGVCVYTSNAIRDVVRVHPDHIAWEQWCMFLHDMKWELWGIGILTICRRWVGRLHTPCPALSPHTTRHCHAHRSVPLSVWTVPTLHQCQSSPLQARNDQFTKCNSKSTLNPE